MKHGPDHLGICNTCLLNCFWQESPTGGWWIHEWPNRLLESRIKGGHGAHNADPGWKPREDMDNGGDYVTVPTKVGIE